MFLICYRCSIIETLTNRGQGNNPLVKEENSNMNLADTSVYFTALIIVQQKIYIRPAYGTQKTFSYRFLHVTTTTLTITGTLTSKQEWVNNIGLAVNEWQKATCIRFQRYSSVQHNMKNFLRIVNNGGG